MKIPLKTGTICIQPASMNVNDLSKLNINELRKVRDKNLLLFNVLAGLDLIVFYHSLFFENWILLFFSFGFFITGLALYDNYKVSRDMVEAAEY